MGDRVYGDKVGGNVFHGNISTSGAGASINISGSQTLSGHDVDEAIAELRVMIAELMRAGVVAPDGSVTRPDALIDTVKSNPSKLRALAKAVAGGAKDAILSVVKDGVAKLIIALI